MPAPTMMLTIPKRVGVVWLLSFSACSTAQAPAAGHDQATPPAPVSPSGPSAPPLPLPPAPVSGPAEGPSPAAASAAPSASAIATAAVRTPDVRVTNIGMHIGGGPNDDVTKAPIRRSVEPHFDEFRKCFGLAQD